MDATGEERRKYIQKSGAVKARAKISVIEKELERRKKVLEAIEFLTGEKTTPDQVAINQTSQGSQQVQMNNSAQAQPTVQTQVYPQSSNNGQSENHDKTNDEDRYMIIEW